MSKCQFCNDEISFFSRETTGHLVANIGKKPNSNEYETHVHAHNMDDKSAMQEFAEAIIEQAGIEDKFYKTKEKEFPFKEVIFHNRQRIGDMFMFTCAIRDFKKAFPNVKVGVISTAMHIWDNNPYIDREITPRYDTGKTLENITPQDFLEGKTNVVKIGPGWLTNKSNSLDWHFANAYRCSIEQALNIHIPQGESRGDIWFTKEEYDAPRVTDKPYWIIITGGEKGWPCKMYPSIRWQEVVNQNPDILFYQLGAAGDNHIRLTGPNVVDYIGKTEDRNTGLRDLLKLFLNAEGSIGLVSFHMHLSGALGKPSVVVAGAREPVSFTRYPGHQYIANDGCLPCAKKACWACALEGCSNIVEVNGEKMPKCVDMISSEEVTRYIRRYYDGGRLQIGKVSEKPKVQIGTPINTAPKKVESPKETKQYNTYGLEFNGGALTVPDWEFILKTIQEHNVKSVLEFGAGLSTLLLNDTVERVVTYEDKQGWIDKLKEIKPKALIYLWDGKNYKDEGELFDLAFIDGPAGDMPREESTRVGASSAKIVIVHDAGREWARKYQEQYIAPYFDGPFKGGNRCHLWIKKQSATKNITPVPSKLNKKNIKFVSTARGYGGCARSTTTIMKLLLQEGHNVEFIPFRNAVGSREMQEIFKTTLKDVKVTTNYDTVKEKCDIFFMYADDYIWEFNKPEISEVFSNINADKKIMMLNYRRGAVGQAEWTKGWDKYMFLNSIQEKELLKFLPNVKTKVLPSCTDLSDFFGFVPNYDGNLRIVRHNSQGDTKFISDMYPKEEASKLITSALECRPDLEIAMLPGPSFYANSDRFLKIPRTDKPKVIADFLACGNLFWYSLPPGYMDMGPRTIIEAMAIGLPILADNWGGAVDRVTPECGWLCNSKEEMIEIIKNVTTAELKKKGEASRDRAMSEFIPQRWIEEIVN